MVQSSLLAKSTSGLSANVVDPPLIAYECEPLTLHAMVIAPLPTFTASLNVTLRLAFSATSASLLAGITLATVGAASATVQGVSGEAVLRGVGDPAVQSLLFWLLSVQPLARRKAAVVLERVGAAAEPS